MVSMPSKKISLTTWTTITTWNHHKLCWIYWEDLSTDCDVDVQHSKIHMYLSLWHERMITLLFTKPAKPNWSLLAYENCKVW